MKTKIALAVALVALFGTVPSASPKGRSPASVGLTVGCTENKDGTDYCSVSGTVSVTSVLTVTDPCGQGGSGNVGPGAFTFFFNPTDCTGVTITLTSGTGRKTVAVPTTITWSTDPPGTI